MGQVKFSFGWIFNVITAMVFLSACQTPPVASSLRAASEDEIARVRPQWIEERCNAGLTRTEFVACATVIMRRMPALDMSKREQFGEHYDPKQWLECMKRSAETGGRGDGACEQYRVRRGENPEYWPNPKMLPVNWPTAPKEATYRLGMSSQNYYEALCKAEAGEFIYKRVSDVDGVYLIRPMNTVYTGNNFDKYVSEAPPAGGRGFENKEIEFEFVRKGKYSFFEKPLEVHLDQYKTYRYALGDESYYAATKLSEFAIARYSGYTGLPIPGGSTRDIYRKMKVEFMQQPKARFGLTWREIRRPADFELAVVGSEIAIVDLTNGEILGLMRDFVMAEQINNAPDGLKHWSESCSVNSLRKNLYSFTEAVLKPVAN